MEDTIAKRLRRIINFTKQSDAAFGKSFNATRNEIHNWLNGIKMNVVRVSDLLRAYPEINAAWFLTGEGSMVNDKYKDGIVKRVVSVCSNPLCVNEKTEMQNIINKLTKRVLDSTQKITELQQDKIEWLERK